MTTAGERWGVLLTIVSPPLPPLPPPPPLTPSAPSLSPLAPLAPLAPLGLRPRTHLPHGKPLLADKEGDEAGEDGLRRLPHGRGDGVGQLEPDNEEQLVAEEARAEDEEAGNVLRLGEDPVDDERRDMFI